MRRPSAPVSRHGHGLRTSLAFDQLPACPSLRVEQRRADHDRGERRGVTSRMRGRTVRTSPLGSATTAARIPARPVRESNVGPTGGRPGGYPCPKNRQAFGGGTAPPAAKAERHVSVEVWSTASVPSTRLPLSPEGRHRPPSARPLVTQPSTAFSSTRTGARCERPAPEGLEPRAAGPDGATARRASTCACARCAEGA